MFLKLTLQNTQEPIYVNMDDIASFAPKKNGGTVLYEREFNTTIHVKEPCDLIFTWLRIGGQNT